MQKLSSILRTLCVAVLLAGCLPGTATPQSPTKEPSTPAESTQTPADVYKAVISFNLQVPEAIGNSNQVYIELLDEVTGLALNSRRIVMNSLGDNQYQLKTALELGSVVKYRYVLQGDRLAIEHNGQNQQVRYRLANVTNQAEIHDVLTGWTADDANAHSGRIEGRILDAVNHSPVADILVAAAGVQTLTLSDGSFLLEGLPGGTHHLVAYSLDGAYQVFQQGALVEEGATTPAEIQMTPSEFAPVTFKVKLPEDSMKGVPVRVVGNLTQLGNSFADLQGGVSVVSTRAPLMTIDESGEYSLTLNLPVGYDLRYKYTLGDGFWNAEHDATGGFIVRQLVVPSGGKTLEDQIASWSVGGNQKPITFSVNAPSSTPPNESVSIQFNPYGWMEPVQMWPMGGNRWLYILYSPLNLVDEFQYRYCRNDQCGSADDVETAGPGAKGHTVKVSGEEQVIQDEISAWTWQTGLDSAATVYSGEIYPREAGFMTGVRMASSYRPSFQPNYSWAFKDAASINSEWVFVTPTWTMTRLSPPVFEPQPGVDPLWADLQNQISAAQNAGLKVVVAPKLAARDTDFETWWAEAPRDAVWWEEWFKRYSELALHHADLAQQTGADALMLGGPEILPALPGGILSNGDPSNAPEDATARWTELLQAVKQRFNGTLLWSQPTAALTEAPEFLSEVDLVYLSVNTPLVSSAPYDATEIELNFAEFMDQQVEPFSALAQRPIVIGFRYNASATSAQGCASNTGECPDVEALEQPDSQAAAGDLDLAQQAAVYNAILSVINQKDWVHGAIAEGYYPATILLDASSSCRGKPSSDVLWYWNSQFLGKE